MGLQSLHLTINETGFKPSNISGLVLWLDSADASSMTFSSGININTWTDKGPNGLIYTSGASTCTRVASGINGKPSFYSYSNTAWFSTEPTFNGSLAINKIATFPYTDGSTTAFFVYQQTSYDTIYNDVYGGIALDFVTKTGDSSKSGYLALPSNTQTEQLRIVSNSGAAAGIAISPSLNTPYYASFNYNGSGVSTTGNWTIQLNGINKTNLGNIGADTPTVYNGLGNRNSRMMIGYIGEIITFNKSLSSDEMIQMNAYLSNKWGI